MVRFTLIPESGTGHENIDPKILGRLKSFLRNSKGNTSFNDMLKMLGRKLLQLSTKNLDADHIY